MPPMPPSRLPLFVLLLLPLSGCCAMARFFCGPDTTPWVSVRFETPRLAVQTLLEALRRDDPEIVCLSCSVAYRKQLGFDFMTAPVAWPRIREQNPAMHLAGYAEVPEPTRIGADRAQVTIDVEGYQIGIKLVRECWREVRYVRPNGTSGDVSESVASFEGLARVERIDDPGRDRSRLELRPLTFDHEGLPSVTLGDIEYAALTRRWKIDYVQLLNQ